MNIWPPKTKSGERQARTDRSTIRIRIPPNFPPSPNQRNIYEDRFALLLLLESFQGILIRVEVDESLVNERLQRYSAEDDRSTYSVSLQTSSVLSNPRETK